MFNKLLKAIQDESHESFERLLKDKKTSKKDVLSTDDDGNSLIHWAAIYNQKSILVSLYKYKFLTEEDRKQIFCKPDSSGRTPLHWCAYAPAPNSCQFLLNTFKKLAYICDEDSFTPLHSAAYENQLQMVEILCRFDERQDQDDPENWLIEARTLDDKLPIDLATDAQVTLCLKKSSLREHSAHQFFGVHLSTHRNYLANSPVKSSPLKESELYPRSSKHPLVHGLGDKAEVCYKKSPVKLAMGMKAHVGSYGNLLQMTGDIFKLKKSPPPHHLSDAKLYDSMLHYKNKLCAIVTDKFKKKCPKSLIKVSHFNEYPSVMVCIPKNSIHKADDTKTPSAAAFENWVNFTLSYFLGLLNFGAWERNLPIEAARRGGFGFLTPTAAPTGASFRISMGIVPDDYITLLVDTLIRLDRIIKKLATNTLVVSEVPEDTFYGSDEHTDYLAKKYDLPELNDLVELLWAQVEKAGQTTMQNIMRTTYGRDGIAQATFQYCHQKGSIQPIGAFNHALTWVTEKLAINKGALSLQAEQDIVYPVRFKDKPYICKDPGFWETIDLMVEKISTLDDKVINACLKKITKCRKQQNLQELYFYLDLLNEAIFAHAVTPDEDENYGDGYGSDSEEEAEIDNEMIYAKKIVTHSGMRAIWAAVTAASSILGNLRVYLQGAYYETPLGLQMIGQLNQLNAITIVKEISKANVIIHDINACITNNVNSSGHLTVKELMETKRYIILDATSATSAQIHSYLPLLTQRRIHSLLVVESGFKNQQLGGDKNPHGIVRIFSKTKKQCNNLYESIKKSEQPLKSATSHRYRHDMKFFGATQSNQAILSKPAEQPIAMPRKK